MDILLPIIGGCSIYILFKAVVQIVTSRDKIYIITGFNSLIYYYLLLTQDDIDSYCGISAKKNQDQVWNYTSPKTIEHQNMILPIRE